MVMGLLLKMMMTKQLSFEGGTIALKDIHLALLPTSFVGELTRYFYLEKRLPQYYMISWMWNYILCAQIGKDYNLNTPDKMYSFGMNLAEAMGIGIYKTHDYFPGRYTHFVIDNNPFFEYSKGIDEKIPIDYFIAGTMAGGGCHVHNAICQCVELRCLNSGDKACEFLTGTEKELKDRGLWETACERYDLKRIYPLQKEFSKKYKPGKGANLIDEMIRKLNSLK
jgi:predicted hydrocarbon binding protein